MRFVFSIELYHLVDGFEQEFIAPLSSWTVIQRQGYPLPTPRARAAQRGPRAGTRRSPGLVRRRVWPGHDCPRGRREWGVGEGVSSWIVQNGVCAGAEAFRFPPAGQFDRPVRPVSSGRAVASLYLADTVRWFAGCWWPLRAPRPSGSIHTRPR